MSEAMKHFMEFPELHIGGDYVDRNYSMFSGQAEAQQNLYKIAIGKSGRIWLYSTADNIYVQGGPKSDGFGGALLEFKLYNGCDSIKLKGPWHSNSDALFQDTQVDIRDTHLTWGVIGTNREWIEGRTVIKDIIWFDKEPLYGTFNRVEDQAKKLASERQQTLYKYVRSLGGSSCGPVQP